MQTTTVLKGVFDNMKIDLSDVLLWNVNRRRESSEGTVNTGKEKAYTVNLEMKTFESRLGSYNITSSSPIELNVINSGKNKVHITGKVDIVLEIPCSRCLEDVPVAISFDFDKDIDFDIDSDNDSEDMEDMSFVDGHQIDVDQMLYSEILMNIPMKTLCKEDCKGICNVCGMNLNKGDCKCDRFVPDPRMAAISDIFKNFGK